MRLILILFSALIFGYGLFLIGQLEPGNYVKIYAASYVIELNLIGFILGLIGGVIVLYFLIWFFRATWRMPTSFSAWRTRSNKKKADSALGDGYLSLIKGDWRRAEKRLTTKSESSGVPYVNYLAAAQAAQELGRFSQRDEYLNAAYKAAPKERLAIGLIKARLHQSAGQFDQAENTLSDIADIGAKNAQFTAMLIQTYQQTGKWDQANQLLSVARKQEALPADVLDDIANKAHTSELNSAADKEAAWKALPKNQRKRAENIVIYAQSLADSGEAGAAEKLIRTALKDTWSDELVRIYGSLLTTKPAKLRRSVEGWLMARPENAELNLAAGRFALQEKNLDLAQEYLQKAIQLGQLPKAYSLLGESYEAGNDSAKALQLYRAGMVNLAQSNRQQILANNNSVEGELLPASDQT